MAEESVSVPKLKSSFDNPTLISKFFIGGYLLIFGWLFIHTVIAFWDLLIPWNITLLQHSIFYGAFTVYIVFLGFSFWYYWKIWSDQEWSVSEATRWPLIASNNFALQFLKYSNMSDEPFPSIGSGWLIDDLRYPAFMSQPYAYLLQIWFVNDAASIFSCSDVEGKSNFLFRLWRLPSEKEKWLGWKENFNGILGLAYIYFSYLFIFMVVSRSWMERIILLFVINFTRNSIATPKAFFQKRQYYLLSFVPAYVLVRAYYSYKEWMAYGSIIVFVLKLAYCLSHLVIFAGWYSDQSSKLGEFTWPFLKVDLFVEAEAVGEMVVVEPEVTATTTATTTATASSNFNLKED